MRLRFCLTPLVLVSCGRRAARLLQHAVRAEDRQRGRRLGRTDEADVRIQFRGHHLRRRRVVGAHLSEQPLALPLAIPLLHFPGLVRGHVPRRPLLRPPVGSGALLGLVNRVPERQLSRVADRGACHPGARARIGHHACLAARVESHVHIGAAGGGHGRAGHGRRDAHGGRVLGVHVDRWRRREG